MLANEVSAKIEVNLFYRTEKRELLIKKELERNGARAVLGVAGRATATIPELHSERRRVDPEGILIADCIFVPLTLGNA